MQVHELERDTLRRLAGLQLSSGQVLSIYVDLNPSEFATPPARETELRSLLDEADRKARNGDAMTHEEKNELREDVERLRRSLLGGGMDAKGAHGLAVFCAGSVDLFEVIKLAQPVASQVVIDSSPYVEPLAEVAASARWCVLLVSRRKGRIFRGDVHALRELLTIEDDVHRWHDQGGWSQARYQRGIEKETKDHVKRTLDAVFRQFRVLPFDGLLLGGPQELVAAVESELHPYLRERLAGRLDVDVESSTAEDVHRVARDAIAETDRKLERALLDRVQAGAGSGGRGAAGLGATLEALNERRVETLLFNDGFSAAGAVCPACGWAAGESVDRCPADGGALRRTDDVVERAVELALAQDAEVWVVRHHDDLHAVGGIGAVLRF